MPRRGFAFLASILDPGRDPPRQGARAASVPLLRQVWHKCARGGTVCRSENTNNLNGLCFQNLEVCQVCHFSGVLDLESESPCLPCFGVCAICA